MFGQVGRYDDQRLSSSRTSILSTSRAHSAASTAHSPGLHTVVMGPYTYKHRQPTLYQDQMVESALHLSGHGCPLCKALTSRFGGVPVYDAGIDDSVSFYHPMVPHPPIGRNAIADRSFEHSEHQAEIRHERNTADPREVKAALDAVHMFISRGTELSRLCRQHGDETGSKRLDNLCRMADKLRMQVAALSTQDPDSPDLYNAARQLRDALMQLQEVICDSLLDRVTEVFSETAYWAQNLESTGDQVMPESFFTWTLQVMDVAAVTTNSGVSSDQRLTNAVNVESGKLNSALSQLTDSFNVRRRGDQHEIMEMKARVARHLTDLNSAVSETVGYAELMQQCEAAFQRRIADCERAMVNGNREDGLILGVKAGRIATWGMVLADESCKQCPDEHLQRSIQSGIDQLENAIADMAANTKNLLSNMRDQTGFYQWKKACDSVAKSLTYLKDLVVKAYFLAKHGPRSSTPVHQPPRRQQRPVTPISDDGRSASSLPFRSKGGDARIMQAAQGLHQAVNMWSTNENELVAEAKRIAMCMAKLSQLVKGIGGDKVNLIECASEIGESANRLDKLALQVASYCDDKIIRRSLIDISARSKTIAAQLKMLCTIKSAMLETYNFEKDPDAFENLVGNAQNLMLCVKDTVHSAEAASIKMRASGGTLRLRWNKKRQDMAASVTQLA